MSGSHSVKLKQRRALRHTDCMLLRGCCLLFYLHEAEFGSCDLVVFNFSKGSYFFPNRDKGFKISYTPESDVDKEEDWTEYKR